MGSQFVPALYEQIKVEIMEEFDKTELIEEAVTEGLSKHSKKHK